MWVVMNHSDQPATEYRADSIKFGHEQPCETLGETQSIVMPNTARQMTTAIAPVIQAFAVSWSESTGD